MVAQLPPDVLHILFVCRSRIFGLAQGLQVECGDRILLELGRFLLETASIASVGEAVFLLHHFLCVGIVKRQDLLEDVAHLPLRV